MEHLVGLQATVLELLDIIHAEINRPDKTLFGMAKWEVLGVSKQLKKGRVALILKYVGVVT